MHAVQLTVGVVDLHEVFLDDLYLLRRRLILHCIIGLRYQVVHVKEVLIKREVHGLKFGKVQ